MLSVEQARDLILAEARCLPEEQTPLLGAAGRVLARDIVSDIDSPPYDKATVDGYALIAPLEVPAQLRVLEEITAGQLPTKTVEPGTATRIMTGVPLPDGANAVVMVERTELVASEGGRDVRILQAPQPSQNIMRRGQSMRRGMSVLSAGKLLRGIEVGILAEVGKSQVPTVMWPRVDVLATGNELVPVDQKPTAGQIRNSNGPLLTTLAAQVGASAVHAGIAPDDAADLKQRMLVALSADIFILSGGVSAGVLDLVPQVLSDCGVREIFRKVNLKPGKPLWFGVKDHAGHRTLVFGLPGNPVSSLVCFELFVRPAIKRLAGHKDCVQRPVQAALAADHEQRGERVTYWPSRLEEAADGTRRITPLPWQGSGDLRTLSDANALVIFPGENRRFAAGETVGVLPLP